MKAFFEKTKMSVKGAGFSLVELLVSISIIILLSIALLLQQSAFDNTIHITNTANEIVLVIQRAQQYSTSVVGGGSYGVHFPAGGREIIFYQNTIPPPPNSPNLWYTQGEPVVEIFSIPRQATIDSAAHGVSIAFRRPNQEPSFFSGSSSWNVGEVNIVLLSEDGSISRTISVSRTGRIFLQDL